MSAPKKIQLLRAGEFVQGDTKKPLKITPELIRSLKKNFDSNARGYPDKKLPVDYFHENDKVAAGWISNVTLNEDATEMFADVEWTPTAERRIKEGELRYVSVEFDYNYRHNEGGKSFGPTLFGAGLTNRPFIKGMNPVTLSEGDNQMNEEQYKAKIAELEAKLKKYESGESEQMSAQKKELEDMKKQCSELTKKLSDVEANAAKEKKLAEKTTKFNKMLSEGKANEAQREAFMSEDMEKFAELAKATNQGKGHSGDGKGGDGKELDPTKTAAEQIFALAEGIVKDRKVSYDNAISIALSENKELSEKYHKENSVR